MADELKLWMPNPLTDIRLSSCEIVVQANDFLVLLHQAVNQVGSEESSPASDEITHLIELQWCWAKKSGGIRPPLSVLLIELQSVQ